MIVILFLTAAVVFFIFRKNTSFLHTKPFVFLEVASVLWWIFLVVDQLRTDLVCTPDDAFCNSGNTVWGDLEWGTMVAFFTLLVVWSLAIAIYFLIQSFKAKR